MFPLPLEPPKAIELDNYSVCMRLETTYVHRPVGLG